MRLTVADHNDLTHAFEEAKLVKNKPTIVIANTIKGKGVSFMENKVEWHYKSPSKKEFGKGNLRYKKCVIHLLTNWFDMPRLMKG